VDKPTPRKKAKQGECPHCGSGCQKIPTPSDNPLEKVIFLQCRNVNCGATFRGVMTITELEDSASIRSRQRAASESDGGHQVRSASTSQPAPGQHRARMGARARSEAAEAGERLRARKLLERHMRPTPLKTG